MRRVAREWVSLFEEDEVPFILAAVLRCGARLRKKDDNENEGKLSNRLRLFLCRDPAFRDSGIMVDREAPIYDNSAEQEDPIGRLDFRFLGRPQRRDTEWYFAIESKRLHVSFPSGWKSCVSEYVTDHQGMMCFVTQRYSRGLFCAGMLGYVMDGNIKGARNAVAAAIRDNSEQMTRAPPCELTACTILAGDERIGESVHKLEHGRFVIYHIFIAV